MRKKTYVILAIFVTVIFLCYRLNVWSQDKKVSTKDNQITLDSTKIKYIKNKRTFVFPVGNNTNAFGFRTYPETGDIASISCIRIIDNSIYLIDGVFSNVKKISVNDGKLTVSENLKRDRTYLVSIGQLNNLLYIFTNAQIAYILDKNLQYKGSIILKDYNGDVNIYSEGKDTLTVFNIAAYWDDAYGKLNLIKFKVDVNGHCIPDTVPVDDDEFQYLERKSNGKESKEFIIGNKMFLRTKMFTYEISESLKDLNNYACIDVDYSDKYLVYFKVNSKRLKLTVLEY